MLRIALAATLLAACYAPAADPACVISCSTDSGCPATLRCGSLGLCEPLAGPSCGAVLDARAADGAIDGQIDTSGCKDVVFTKADVAVDARMFTPDALGTRFSIYKGNTIGVADGSPPTSPGDYLDAFPPVSGMTELLSGRIDATGQRLYYVTHDGLNSSAWLLVPAGAGTWSNPIIVKFTRVATEVPVELIGTTSLTGSMLVVGIAGIDEYKASQVMGTFEHVAYTQFAMIGASGAPVEVNITSDGLRMVFVDVVSNQSGIYMSERTSPSAPWSVARRVITVDSGATAPYLAADCSELYWAVGNTTMRAIPAP